MRPTATGTRSSIHRADPQEPPPTTDGLSTGPGDRGEPGAARMAGHGVTPKSRRSPGRPGAQQDAQVADRGQSRRTRTRSGSRPSARRARRSSGSSSPVEPAAAGRPPAARPGPRGRRPPRRARARKTAYRPPAGRGRAWSGRRCRATPRRSDAASAPAQIRWSRQRRPHSATSGSSHRRACGVERLAGHQHDRQHDQRTTSATVGRRAGVSARTAPTASASDPARATARVVTGARGAGGCPNSCGTIHGEP